MNAYKGFTEAQAKAHRKYMSGMATIQLRMTAEEREQVKARAAARGESINEYVTKLVFADIAQAAGADPVQAPTAGGSGAAAGGAG